MTSYNISELPIPYRSAGASPLGTHEGTVTPPEPPIPPTPGLTYFSGTSIKVTGEGGGYRYSFDASAGENADRLYEKGIGDELSVTINGTDYTAAITTASADSDTDYSWKEIHCENVSETIADVSICPQVENGTGVWSYYETLYVDRAQQSGDFMTLVIADPS